MAPIKYGLEVHVRAKDNTMEWVRMRPTGSDEPYVWDTHEKAERMAYICFGNNPAIIRVVEVK